MGDGTAVGTDVEVGAGDGASVGDGAGRDVAVGATAGMVVAVVVTVEVVVTVAVIVTVAVGLAVGVAVGEAPKGCHPAAAAATAPTRSARTTATAAIATLVPVDMAGLRAEGGAARRPRLCRVTSAPIWSSRASRMRSASVSMVEAVAASPMHSARVPS